MANTVTGWIKPGALCTYHRNPRTVLRVDSTVFDYSGDQCVLCREWSIKRQKKSGPQGMYAVRALKPYTEKHKAKA